MRCPYCGTDDDHVVDSRSAEDGAAVRRRRECRMCGQRFSTYERAEQVPLSVRKRSGAVEPFDRNKVAVGIAKATKDLSPQSELIHQATARVEARVRGLGRREVSSEVVGSEVLLALRELDPMAYVRFASVYKDFTSPEDFARELARLQQEAAPRPSGSSAAADADTNSQ